MKGVIALCAATALLTLTLFTQAAADKYAYGVYCANGKVEVDSIRLKGEALFAAPPRIELKQLSRHLGDSRLCPLFHKLPFIARELVDFGSAAVGSDIFLDYIHLLNGNVKHVRACVFYFYIIFRLSVDFELLKSYKFSDTVIFARCEA